MPFHERICTSTFMRKSNVMITSKVHPKGSLGFPFEPDGVSDGVFDTTNDYDREDITYPDVRTSNASISIAQNQLGWHVTDHCIWPRQ